MDKAAVMKTGVMKNNSKHVEWETRNLAESGRYLVLIDVERRLRSLY